MNSDASPRAKPLPANPPRLISRAAGPGLRGRTSFLRMGSGHLFLGRRCLDPRPGRCDVRVAARPDDGAARGAGGTGSAGRGRRVAGRPVRGQFPAVVPVVLTGRDSPGKSQSA